MEPDDEQGLQEGYFFTVENSCKFPVDFKLCFEDTRGTADCRETSQMAPRSRKTEAKPDQFMGDGIKLYLRYSSDAKLCQFPLTRDVRF